MGSIRTSAPGKIVFCGEYVVLDGAPAVGMAVSCRSRVSLHSIAGDLASLRCPGYTERAQQFRYSGGRADWLSAAGLPLVDAALANLAPADGFGGVLDTAAFRLSAADAKLGLGSSASLAVSLTAALAGLAGVDVEPGLADKVHRDFQGGKGSGLDVATCFHGGLVEFVRDTGARRLSWPAGLYAGVFWSGIPSSTTDRIGRYRAAAAHKASVRALAKASAAVVAALADAGGTLEALSEYARALQAFDADHALGIYTAGHDAVADAAQGLPLVYKPCGAGGGDVGIAVSCSAEPIEDFARRVAEFGYVRLDLEIDNRGLVIEEWSP